MMFVLLSTKFGKKEPVHAIFAGLLSDVLIAYIIAKILGGL